MSTGDGAGIAVSGGGVWAPATLEIAATRQGGDDEQVDGEFAHGGLDNPGRKPRQGVGRPPQPPLPPPTSPSGSPPRAPASLPPAPSSVNHPARSISGNCWRRPERGGHSISKLLLRTAPASRSPRAAHAVTSLPPFCTTVPSSTSSSVGSRVPVSSSNSRRAATRGSSSGSYSPLGIDLAPRSFLAQNGPPGCTSSTSGPRSATRCSTMPALRPFATG